MKIVHISIYPPKGKKHSFTGGVASYTKNLVTNIPYQTTDTVFVLCDKVNDFEEYTEDGIKIIRCFERNIKFFFQVFKNIKKIKPDVIHFQQELSLYGNMVNAYLLQWLIFLFKAQNVIVTLHGVVSLKKIDKRFVTENNSQIPVVIVKQAFKIFFKPICLWATKIVVHEECFKNVLIEEYGVKSSKIEVIAHGVEDFKTIRKIEACASLDLDCKKDIVLFMGYLTGYKGLDLLIEGFSVYSKVNPNSFLIIGAGKHPKLFNDKRYLSGYNRIKTKAGEIIANNQYRWVGFIDEKDITNYYSASDLSVFPYTIQMSSSGPMMIAIGQEKPFLASDVFREVLKNDRVIFEKKKESLALRLENFFSNQDSFYDYVKKIKSKRRWSSIGKITLNLYHEITCVE